LKSDLCAECIDCVNGESLIIMDAPSSRSWLIFSKGNQSQNQTKKKPSKRSQEEISPLFLNFHSATPQKETQPQKLKAFMPVFSSPLDNLNKSLEAGVGSPYPPSVASAQSFVPLHSEKAASSAVCSPFSARGSDEDYYAAQQGSNEDDAAGCLPPSAVSPNDDAGVDALPPRARRRYHPVRIIGQGAYGAAWLCVDTHDPDRRYVVVKSLSIPSMTDKEWALLQNEVHCLSVARHPNIIEFYEATKEDLHHDDRGAPSDASAGRNARQLIVMEFADAGDLRRIVKLRKAAAVAAAAAATTTPGGGTGGGTAPPPEAAYYFSAQEVMFLFIQIAMAVHKCHDLSILHRDIKSANILMRTNGLVKLGDFGLSRRYEKHQQPATQDDGDAAPAAAAPPLDVSSATSIAQTFCGTPYYLAPELWRGHRYGKAADIWSLGIVLYEMITLGRRPFTGETVHALASRIVTGAYDPLPTQSRSVDSGTQALIAQLLDVDPGRRPLTRLLFQLPFVKQHLSDLREALQSNPAISSSVKTLWRQEADKLLALPPITDDLRRASLAFSIPDAYSGFVRRYAAQQQPQSASSSTAWVLHKLQLERAGAVLVLGPAAEAQVPSTRKEIPTQHLDAVMPVPPESSFGLPGVFALTTKDGRCTWFQAQSDTEQRTWVRLLRLAIGLHVQSAHHQQP
jgi:serine/threonine protein kinase